MEIDFDSPPQDPFALFDAWLADAREAEPNDPTAMALATVDKDNMPNVRMVLLKDWQEGLFTFYTNMQSTKGQELDTTPHAALCFHWKSCRRQIRIRGTTHRVDDAKADAYHQSRHPESRLGAWASLQSQPLAARAILEQRFADYKAQYGMEDIPRPPYWAGWSIKPLHIEFWQDGAHRLHDRIIYKRDGESWHTQRLYP